MNTDNESDQMGRWQLPLMITGICVLLLSGWFSVSYLVGPPVPRTLTIATGSSTGVYHRVAMQYRKTLDEHGIDLQILETNGSIENLRLLQEGEATLAIVQGGTGTPEERENLSSLASLYLEPVWIFYSDAAGEAEELTDFQGRRIAVGPPGSGTHSIAVEWLTANGFERPGEAAGEQVADDGTVYVTLNSVDAAAALENGDVDVAFYVVGAESEIVSELVAADGIHLLNIDRARPTKLATGI